MIAQILLFLKKCFYDMLPFADGAFFVTRYPFATATIQVKRTTAGDSDIVVIGSNESIIITDFIFSSDKKNAGTVVICYDDGTRTFNIVDIDVTDSSPAFSFSPQGHVFGWLGADLRIVTAGAAFTASLTVWYKRVPKSKSLTYDQWIALR